MYENGLGVKRDYVKAREWYEKAVAANTYGRSSEASKRLGYMYEKGLGVKKDKDKAREWYEKANAQDNH